MRDGQLWGVFEPLVIFVIKASSILASPQAEYMSHDITNHTPASPPPDPLKNLSYFESGCSYL
jgi:hypothetical protein